uniref:RNA-directed DNA polymerase n=1 Tax=Ceratitis capitata TaxID=7213 RepID=W8C8G1_CERCA
MATANKTEVSERIEMLIERNQNAFANPNRALPYNTKVIARIDTQTDTPIYSKSYPYPISAAKFINKEIESLLKDGIIRKSYSPYNSPVHVVSKKGLDDEGNQKLRMVIDFRKLNEQTTSDKYPIPDTSVILSNLGKSTVFTTLDLKSGFHQICLLEKDRCKTAFSINNGKYEFCRLPFGLKNAPSIFQRAIDDILREDIGKICHVYVDDIIIFSPDEISHFKDVDTILKKIERAGMRVSEEKSKFFKEEVEFLGFTVSSKGIRTSPSKVEAILNYQEPKSLRSLRSFLGLSGYYRRFIKDYAHISKHLTKYLRGENGHVNSRHSKKINISLDEEAIAAFNKLKSILASEDVLLQQPDYNKPFEITTDASSVALGAVLSQNGKPITMISRTLSKTEENYATNERELLAIVWAFQKLRHYLYGIKNIHIYTDHQPLTFAISDRNPNSKIKRWTAFINSFAPKYFYKPGKENQVADALSRQYTHNLDDSMSTVHSEISLSAVIKTIKNPVNQFKAQFVLSTSEANSKSTKILFQKLIRHTINFKSAEFLLQTIREKINPNVVNGICCDLETLARIQSLLLSNFPGVKFVHTEKLVIDLIKKEDQIEAATMEHNRAHRSIQENYKQLVSEYFFPEMKKTLTTIAKNCRICMENKYNRHPSKTEVGKTPIPEYPGQILHIDIFSVEKFHFLTCIDKFSKFTITIPIESRSTIDIKSALLIILNKFRKTKLIISDNEKSFQSHTVANLLKDQFQIDQFFIPPLHSNSNGQIERVHSTLTEIARCIKAEQNVTDTKDLILLATYKYNNSMHSTVNTKPIDILNNFSKDHLSSIKATLITAQENIIKNSKNSPRTFKEGEKVYVRRNKRLGSKLNKVYIENVVQKDLGTTVLINGKKIHKDNIR